MVAVAGLLAVAGVGYYVKKKAGAVVDAVGGAVSGGIDNVKSAINSSVPVSSIPLPNGGSYPVSTLEKAGVMFLNPAAGFGTLVGGLLRGSQTGTVGVSDGAYDMGGTDFGIKDTSTWDYAPKPNLATDGQGYYITPKPDTQSVYQKYGENFGVSTDYWGGGFN